MVSIRGQIDSSFTTDQRDLFASGIVAEIGVTAYAVWHGIKYYADYNTGEAFPGMRTLGQKLGVSKDTINRAIDSLVQARMLRVVKPHTKRKGQTYIARERMTVRVGSAVLCTILIDYVPERLRGQVKRVTDAISAGKDDPEAFAEVEIIPGDGFVWDESSKSLRGRIEASQLPAVPADEDAHYRQIGEAILSRVLPGRKVRS
jgi:DNA-binding MarR family transcriptional regulator